MTRDDVEIITRTERYTGFLKIEEYRLRHRLFAGGWSPPLSRELMERGHAVAAALYDPVRERLVLIEQFRIGAHAAGETPWMFECVAGMRKAHEDPVEVVRREVKEETGLDVLAIEHACRTMASPGGTSECCDVFLAKVDSRHAGGIHGLAHEGEDIRVVAEDFDDAFASFFDGRRLGSAFTLIALQALALNRARLRALWLKETGT
ncbi:MAG: NUDIX domain-containing protein [Azospirillum sp.]|nr:NUDIX domain-containing protein [Azospirillum sp.]